MELGRSRGRPRHKDMNEVERDILKKILETHREEGLQPSLRELGAFLGTSHQAASSRLSLMERKGFLKRVPGRRRAILITQLGRDLIGDAVVEDIKKLPEKRRKIVAS